MCKECVAPPLGLGYRWALAISEQIRPKIGTGGDMRTRGQISCPTKGNAASGERLQLSGRPA